MERRAEPEDAANLEAAIHFQRDLYLYWRMARAAGGVALTPRRFVARPALRRIRERLATAAGSGVAGSGVAGSGVARQTDTSQADPTEGEDTRLLFTRRLLERLGLLRAEPEAARLVAAPHSEMARYLAHPLARRLRIGARLWVAGGWWPDRPDPRGQPPRVMTPAPPRLALARRRLLESLAALAPGELVTLPTPPITAPSPRPATRAHPRPRPNLPALPGEEETISAALRGPLAWMGFITSDPAAGANAWRASAALAALREEEAPALPETSGRIVAQANLEIIAYPPLPAPLLAALDTWAEEVSLETTARYRLSRPALARALHAGWTAERVAAALAALTAVPLPPNLPVTLADWARSAERIRFTPAASILETTAPLLDALLADRTAAGWVERRLSPSAALLAPGHAEHVRAWLLRRGELPAFSRAVVTDDDSASS